jgi:lauroyl/myristoyl acyltransferase
MRYSDYVKENLNRVKYSEFHRNETRFYNPKFIRQYTQVNDYHIDKNKGGVLHFIHYGSFFLSGYILSYVKNLKYTAIASKRNLPLMNKFERNQWVTIFRKCSRWYFRKLFFSDEKVNNMVKFLNNGGYLGVASDVKEDGVNHKTRKFAFGSSSLNLQNVPERLAKICNCPLYPMIIYFDSITQLHNLYIGPGLMYEDGMSIQQITLDYMYQITQLDTRQFFHDIDLHFNAVH